MVGSQLEAFSGSMRTAVRPELWTQGRVGNFSNILHEGTRLSNYT